jgi:hypothetical protein
MIALRPYSSNVRASTFCSTFRVFSRRGKLDPGTLWIYKIRPSPRLDWQTPAEAALRLPLRGNDIRSTAPMLLSWFAIGLRHPRVPSVRQELLRFASDTQHLNNPELILS